MKSLSFHRNQYCLFTHAKSSFTYSSPAPRPLTHDSVMTEYYPLNLHTKLRPPWRACSHIHPGSSAEKEENRWLSEKFSFGNRIALDRAQDSRGNALAGLLNIHNKLTFIMDALKSAGRAIIRSPSLAKQSWISGKHKSEFHCCQSARILPGNDVYICCSVLKFGLKVVSTCVLKQESTITNH